MNAETSDISVLMPEKDIIIDARNEEQYQGRSTTPGVFRKGRIPGAINVPWTENFDTSGKFKSAKELQILYQSQEVTPDKTVSVYCHSGFQSTVTYFVLSELLGYPKVANYDASWIGWSRDERLPIECDYSKITVGYKKCEVHGESRTIDTAPYLKDGSVYVPLRFLSWVVGGQLDWTNGVAVLHRDDLEIRVVPGESTLWVNGSALTIVSPAPEINAGWVTVPIRPIAEILGIRTEWDPDTQTVHLVSNYGPFITKSYSRPT